LVKVNGKKYGNFFLDNGAKEPWKSWTNKLECLPLASLSSVVLCNTVTYWAGS